MMIAEKIGHGFVGHRKDGRVLSGEIVKVTETAKGTLVVLKNGQTHKSLYLHEMNGYGTMLSNGQSWWPEKIGA